MLIVIFKPCWLSLKLLIYC